MDFPFNENFKAQAIKYNLKYRCVDCTHFDELNAKCSFEYPIDNHHSYFYILKYPHGDGPRFTFCKYFEIN